MSADRLRADDGWMPLDVDHPTVEQRCRAAAQQAAWAVYDLGQAAEAAARFAAEDDTDHDRHLSEIALDAYLDPARRKLAQALAYLPDPLD